MSLSIISDFDRDDLEAMMDLEMKYSGVSTYFDDFSDYIPTFNLEYEPRDYCSDTMKEYSNPHTISTSWATATIAAAEYVLHKVEPDTDLSLDYILDCLPKYAERSAFREVTPRDIIEFISMKGLMNEEDAKNHIESKEDLCTFKDGEVVYRFTTEFPEAINQSGLKNLSSSGYPVVTFMALDLVRLRTVRSMDDEDVCTGAHYDATVYGVLQGEKANIWSVDLYVVPCERVHLTLPLLDSKGNPYAGIAAYAFSIENVNIETVGTPSEEPTAEVTEIPTTDIPTPTPTPTLEPGVFVCNSCSLEELTQPNPDIETIIFSGFNQVPSEFSQMDLSGLPNLRVIKVLDESTAFADALLNGSIQIINYSGPGLSLIVGDYHEYNTGGRRLQDAGVFPVNNPAISTLILPSGVFNNYHTIDLQDVSDNFNIVIPGGDSLMNITTIKVYHKSLNVAERLKETLEEVQNHIRVIEIVVKDATTNLN